MIFLKHTNYRYLLTHDPFHFIFANRLQAMTARHLPQGQTAIAELRAMFVSAKKQHQG